MAPTVSVMSTFPFVVHTNCSVELDIVVCSQEEGLLHDNASDELPTYCPMNGTPDLSVSAILLEILIYKRRVSWFMYKIR